MHKSVILGKTDISSIYEGIKKKDLHGLLVNSNAELFFVVKATLHSLTSALSGAEVYIVLHKSVVLEKIDISSIHEG